VPGGLGPPVRCAARSCQSHRRVRCSGVRIGWGVVKGSGVCVWGVCMAGWVRGNRLGSQSARSVERGRRGWYGGGGGGDGGCCMLCVGPTVYAAWSGPTRGRGVVVWPWSVWAGAARWAVRGVGVAQGEMVITRPQWRPTRRRSRASYCSILISEEQEVVESHHHHHHGFYLRIKFYNFAIIADKLLSTRARTRCISPSLSFSSKNALVTAVEVPWRRMSSLNGSRPRPDGPTCMNPFWSCLWHYLSRGSAPASTLFKRLPGCCHTALDVGEDCHGQCQHADSNNGVPVATDVVTVTAASQSLGATNAAAAQTAFQLRWRLFGRCVLYDELL